MMYTNRRIEVGGLSKETLMEMMESQSVKLNEYAHRLFEDERFTTSKEKYSVDTVERTVMDLGFSEGATLSQIYERARERGLGLCPLELAPHFRLQYRDQPEDTNGSLLSNNHAPTGSVTVASPVLSEEEDFPTGFYLRNIAGDKHIWSPDDCFLFTNLGSKK